MVKFLVIRFSSIGDIILTTPVVRHLKQQVEDSEVHFLTKEVYAPLLEANPYVDRIHSHGRDMQASLRELKKEGFDYLIDLHHNTRTARIKFALKRMDFTVKKLNVRKWLFVNFKLNRLPELHIVDRNLETIAPFVTEWDGLGLDYFIPEGLEVPLSSLPEAFRKGYTALAIGARHETKMLPTASLIRLCEKLPGPILVLGGPGDREKGEALNRTLPHKQILDACGRYTIHQSASLVKQSSLLITHDTGLMHIGAAFGKKIITVWGNTVPAFGMYPYRPDPASVDFEVKGLPCRPCSKIGYQRCPKKHFRCMLDQDLDGMAAAARDLLGS